MQMFWKLLLKMMGKGFPEDEIENVFDKFYRLKNSKTGGTGLGLVNCKRIYRSNERKCNLREYINRGRKFTIEIPAETSYLKNLKNE